MERPHGYAVFIKTAAWIPSHWNTKSLGSEGPWSLSHISFRDNPNVSLCCVNSLHWWRGCKDQSWGWQGGLTDWRCLRSVFLLLRRDAGRACLATAVLIHCLWNHWRICLVGWSQRGVTKGWLCQSFFFFFSVFYDALTFLGFADLGRDSCSQG